MPIARYFTNCLREHQVDSAWEKENLESQYPVPQYIEDDIIKEKTFFKLEVDDEGNFSIKEPKPTVKATKKRRK